MVERRLRSGAKVPVSGCSIVQYFESLPDPRHRRNRRHLLVDVITIAVCGVIVGCDGPATIRAWATENGLSLGQVATEEKSNEITAIPGLIDRINVKGAIVTIDAMGCQKEIAKKIIDAQGDYVLAVKDNQPKLHEAILAIFSDDHQADLFQMPHRQHQTTDHGHKDERRYLIGQGARGFSAEASVAGLEGHRHGGSYDAARRRHDGTTAGDVRYFISSAFTSGQRFAEAARGHWAIENSLHWVLDVTFGEDRSRTRKRRIADHLSWLRRFAISLLKRHPSEESIKSKSRMAGWSNEFLMQVLEAQGV